MEHTKEPWVLYHEIVGKRHFVQIDIGTRTGRNPCIVHDAGFDANDLGGKQNAINARRIVACVNACAGMEKPKEWIDECERLRDQYKSQRDELLAALHFYANPDNWKKDDWGVPSIINPLDYGDPGKTAREAIALAESKEAQERKKVAYSCGCCGAPLNADKEQVAAPEGYDPDDYPHDACYQCMVEEEEPRMRVTREMALDAGDPSLEGTEY